MNRHLTSRLAARSGTRAAELIVYANRMGNITRYVIESYEKRILEFLDHNSERLQRHRVTQRAILEMIHDYPRRFFDDLRRRLADLYEWAHNHATAALINTLPKAYLRAAYARRAAGRSRLREHGPIIFGVDLTSGPPQFTTQDLSVSDKDEENLWKEFLFPQPDRRQTESFLDRILGHKPTPFLGGTATPIMPNTLAGDIASRFAAGDSTQEIGRFIRPYFAGSAMRAERTARTVGAYVGTERNLATSEALGDLVIGYQVHSAGGENARHAHALRSGTIYYKEPKAGQHSVEVMPHPPQDTQRGPHDDMEAPRGLAYNCRCWITPVLAPLPAMNTPAFTDNADRLIPDPAHFADWFATATTPQRTAAAGLRRLAVAEKLLGRAPSWADIVDPDSGQLLGLDELRGETEKARHERRAKVQAIISVNRALTKRAAAFGTV